MPLGETIVALGTPVGESAIAMVRLSGPRCRNIIEEVMEFNSGIVARKALLGRYLDRNGVVLDEVVFMYFEDNKSYTGEKMVEICCHGNLLIVQRMIEDLIMRGCRMAEGGEFTRTAFLNGRIDLSQAEAVQDLIAAKSEMGISVAQKQLAGSVGRKVDEFVERLLQSLAEVEAYIDFPEDDLPEEQLERVNINIDSLASDFKILIETERHKALLQDGVKVAIVGAPNAGKSSLMNYLVGEERAIVSPTPGTTRDFIAEKVMVGPYCLRLMDTAGVHDAEDEIERLGINKSMEKVQEADIHIFVVDSSMDIPVFPEAMMDMLEKETTLVVENKIDLSSKGRGVEVFLKDYERCRLSLTTQEGLNGFMEKLQDFVNKRVKDNLGSEGLVMNSRHAAALKKARECLGQATRLLKVGESPELVATEMYLAKSALGEIVGEIDNEKMLDQLFSAFCIGK